MNNRKSLMTVRQLDAFVSKQPLLAVENLRIGHSECVILTGDNGSGKSTLMQILSAIEKCARLTISIEEAAAASNSNSQREAVLKGQRARRWLFENTVYLHQQAYMFDRSVRDNIAYGLAQRNTVDDLDKVVSKALEWSGLSKLADRNARHLSGGEKQRVALTRARIVRPVLLLLDEPTGGLDRRSRLQTYALIKQLSDEGMTIIVSTHDDPANFGFADVYWNINQTLIHVSDRPFTQPETYL